jgi:hypothetical protein
MKEIDRIEPIETRTRQIEYFGSVGLRRIGFPRASFRLLGTDRRIYDYERGACNVEKAAEETRRASLPQHLHKRLYPGV